VDIAEARDLLGRFANKVPVKLAPLSKQFGGGGRSVHTLGVMLGLQGEKAVVKPKGHRKTEVIPLEFVMKWKKGMALSNIPSINDGEVSDMTDEKDTETSGITPEQELEIIQSTQYLLCSYDDEGKVVFWDTLKWVDRWEDAKVYKKHGAKTAQGHLRNRGRGNGLFCTKLPAAKYNRIKPELSTPVNMDDDPDRTLLLWSKLNGQIVFWDGLKWKDNHQEAKRYAQRAIKIARTRIAKGQPEMEISIVTIEAAEQGLYKVAPEMTEVKPAEYKTKTPEYGPVPTPRPVKTSSMVDLLSQIEQARHAVATAQAMLIEERSKLDHLKYCLDVEMRMQ
jgi:hypothetical protein